MTVVKCPSCGAAISVPERKTGLWWGIGCLIAALAIPFIVAFVGLFAAIAIPSFVKARDTSRQHMCANNLRMLDAAKEQAALEHNHKDGDAVSEQEVSPFLKGRYAGLACPKGGLYTLNPIGQAPACSVHGPLADAFDGRTPVPRPAAEAPGTPRAP